MEITRKQLTLFLNEPSGTIEKIRAEFNPVQFHLIPAHVTLCREDEIEPIQETIERIESISLAKPVRVELEKLERFSNEKGLCLSSLGTNNEFKELRKRVLGQTELKKEQIPHITLMHPRNSTCTDPIFKAICSYVLPTKFEFGTISLIEQKNGGTWKVLREFSMLNIDDLNKNY